MATIPGNPLRARHAAARLAGALLLCAALAAAAGGRDLAAAGSAARARGGAVLLVFRADGCSYCELLEREVLGPWQLSSDYDPRIVVVPVDIDAARLTDFDGRATSGTALAERYAVRVTPTVLPVDGGGRPLAEPLVGIASVDFYPDYLQRAVERALARVTAPRRGTARRD